jgi:hypothetical protein
MLRSLALGGLFGLAACASAPAEETGASGDAVSTGGRWRSTLDEGFYDHENRVTLFIGHDVTQQTFDLTVQKGRDWVSCGGVIDVALTGEHAGEMRYFGGKLDGCTLTFMREGNNVRVKGSKATRSGAIPVDVTLEPRQDNAFATTYVDAEHPDYAQAEVEATSNAEAKLRITVEGKDLVALQTGEVDDNFDHYVVAVDDDCSLQVKFGFNMDGKRTLFLHPLTFQDPEACPANMPTYLREK